MALSIKNEKVEKLAKELAWITGKPITEAVFDGLRRELERQKSMTVNKLVSTRYEKIMQIGKACAAIPTRDQLSEDEILGYDEFGIPSR